tara:strand:- start:14453 stop:14602 length:150 start_codon:yes stop_codon:yes gene_type:complete
MTIAELYEIAKEKGIVNTEILYIDINEPTKENMRIKNTGFGLIIDDSEE